MVEQVAEQIAARMAAVKERISALDAEGREAFAREAYAQARRCFEQAAEACRAIGWDEEQIVQILLVSQAMAREPLYEPADARPLLDEALKIAQAAGEPQGILPVQISRLRVDLEEGHYEDALRLAQAALPMALQAGLEDFAAALVQSAAFACVGLERFEAALRLHNAAQAQRDRGSGTPPQSRAAREAMERNLAPARKAFPVGKRSAIEAMGYQMSLAEVGDYVAGLVVEG